MQNALPFDRPAWRQSLWLLPLGLVYFLHLDASPGTLVVIPGSRTRPAEELLAKIEASGRFECTVIHRAVSPGVPPFLDPLTVFMLPECRPR